MTSETTTYHLDDYTAWLRSWSASPRTVTQRVKAVRRMAQMWPDPSTVTPEDIAAWLASDDYSKWTRCTYYSDARSVFGWLASAGHISTDPTSRVRRPATPHQRPRPLSAREQGMVLAESRGRLHVWLLLGLYAGLRVHEIAKIRGEDVTADVIYVRGKGGRDEMIPTHPSIWEAAVSLPRAGYWFPQADGERPIVPDTVTSGVTKLFRRLGIEGSAHRCRHSYGTNLLRAGVNLRVVQELMRHRSLATTAGYLGVGSDETAEAIRRLAA